jgi:hypothetical protein
MAQPFLLKCECLNEKRCLFGCSVNCKPLSPDQCRDYHQGTIFHSLDNGQCLRTIPDTGRRCSPAIGHNPPRGGRGCLPPPAPCTAQSSPYHHGELLNIKKIELKTEAALTLMMVNTHKVQTKNALENMGQPPAMNSCNRDRLVSAAREESSEEPEVPRCEIHHRSECKPFLRVDPYKGRRCRPEDIED